MIIGCVIVFYDVKYLCQCQYWLDYQVKIYYEVGQLVQGQVVVDYYLVVVVDGQQVSGFDGDIDGGVEVGVNVCYVYVFCVGIGSIGSKLC